VSAPTVVSALSPLPAGLRDALVKALNEIVTNYRAHRWEPSELNGGKLCETTYTILRGHVDGQMPSAPSKPSNFVDACRALEVAGSHFPRSVRIQIPRVLMALYEVRNNRGVGHVGGDVDPNHMDATLVLGMSKWIIAELIRVFHQVDTTEATALVDTLVEREIPAVWEVNGKRRVLDASLTMREKTLLLLYAHRGPVTEGDLVSWVEHSNPSVYRRDVLKPAHKQKLLEYDQTARTVEISPTGVRMVEENIRLSAAA
jgi:hypothetical protein